MDDRERQHLVEELRRWWNDHQPRRDLRKRLWQTWMPSMPGIIQPVDETKRNPYISKVRDPRATHAVETILPRVVGEEPRMSYKAIDSAEDEPVAAIMAGLTTWQMERMGFENEVRNFVRQGLVANWTVAKVGWIREERQVKVPREDVHFDDLLGTWLKLRREETQTLTVRNQPFFETVDADDFVYPLTARSIQTAEAVWQRRFVTRAYLEARTDVYTNVGDVSFEDSGRAIEAKRGVWDAQGLAPSSTIEGDKPEDGVAEIWERWGLYEGEASHLWVVANPLSGDGVELRDEENPFDHKLKPFVDWSPIPHPFLVEGIGVVILVYDLNEHLNTLLRQLSDARTFQLNPAWKSTGLAGKQLALFPGMNLEVDDLEDITPLIMPQIDFAAGWQEVQQIRQMIQDVSGAFEYLGGGTSPDQAQQTATGVATIANEGNKRISEMIKVFGERAMKPFGWQLSLLNAQYIDEEVAVDFSRDPEALAAWRKFTQGEQAQGQANAAEPGPGLIAVDPQMIVSQGRLEPMPDVGQDKQVNDIQRRSDAVQFLQVMQTFAALPQQVVNWKAIASYVGKAFGIPKADLDSILAVTDQPSQMDLMQLEAQLNPPANGSGPSGPSGDNLPTGNVVGTPGASGPSGPAGMGGLA